MMAGSTGLLNFLVVASLFSTIVLAVLSEESTVDLVRQCQRCRSNEDCQNGFTCQIYNDQEINGCSVEKKNSLEQKYCLSSLHSRMISLVPPQKALTIVDSKKRPLGRCEGPCFDHTDCGLGLNCHRFNRNGEVQGCSGRHPGFKRFCFKPAPKVLVRKGIKGQPAYAYPLGMCQGECRGDSDCGLGLICYRRKNSQAIHGCLGGGIDGKNYCTVPPSSSTLVRKVKKHQKRSFLLGACEGECRTHHQCKPGLKCYERKHNEKVVRCFGYGIEKASYCYEPDNTEATSDKENKKAGSNNPVTQKRCTPSSPCSMCQSHCAGRNSNCKAGLVCFSKTSHNGVPFCAGKGLIPGVDYCSIPSSGKPIKYSPGDLLKVEAGLLLSKGLTARIIATQGQHVKLEHNGQKSKDRMHVDPDGAAVFENKKTGGWRYVSNAESSSQGGVGAIEFNARGQVIGYERLLSGSRRNCGGGATFWKTWLSCEEYENGQIWEVDPFGRYPPRKTIMGIKGGDMYESAAYDNRNPRKPVFYITTDDEDGPVLKFSPDAAAISKALKSNNFSRLLHSNETGTAKTEFLVLQPNKKKSGSEGTFFWTEKIWIARKSAKDVYPNCEGIDVRYGIVYFTCKRRAELFILDTNHGTYTKESIKSGAFNGNPDQVARVLGGKESDDILYFCEAKGSSATDCGVFGRDIKGNYFTILENNGSMRQLTGEVTGLAFSPNNKYMYLSFQKPGLIYEIKRTDGYAFGGQQIDIKYHKYG